MAREGGIEETLGPLLSLLFVGFNDMHETRFWIF